MARHRLIAIATPNYRYMAPEHSRPQLVGVHASIVELFTKSLSVYSHELQSISIDPTADAMRRELDTWFAAPERDPADWVVMYFTGHGEVVGAETLYLLPTDFKPRQYVGTAFNLQQLGDLVLTRSAGGLRRNVRNLLVIVDTCFAGTGVAGLVDSLANAFRRTSGGAFYLLGAALPSQEAKAGALAKALIESVDELSNRHVTQQWLYLDQIVPAINQRLDVHEAILCAISAPREEPKFFPNRGFIGMSERAVLSSDALRAIEDSAYRKNWGARAQSAEFDGQAGAYFVGRTKIIDELSRFLRGEGDSRTRVVTGRPGSGKSTIIDRLIKLSEGQERGHGGDGADASMPSINIALYLKGRTLEETKGHFASILGVKPTIQAILNRLEDSNRTIHVVVDALDEATEPGEIARQLLAPLNAIAEVRLVVGTREAHVSALEGAVILNIDTPEHADVADIAAYVKARLQRLHEPSEPTPYRGAEVTTERVAAFVAAKAYPNFLVARLTIEGLLLQPTAMEPDALDEMAFPHQVGAAFDAFLSRFGNQEGKVRAFMTPLAYAQGQGLPWDTIWVSLVNAISGERYNDDDVRWVLRNAGAFIVESLEEGRAVYRLYHQALADTIRERQRNPQRVHATFVEVLTQSVPGGSRPGALDWLIANPYIRSWLAAHAERCGALGHLLRDPLYLLAASPVRLMSVLARSTDYPRDIAAIYGSVLHHIRNQPPGVAASYLELASRQRGANDFADAVAALPLARGWRVRWAKWSPAIPDRSIARGGEEIFKVVAANLGGHKPVALVGRVDGLVEVWDIENGECLMRWRADGVGVVRELALAQTETGPQLVAGWSSGHLGVYNMSTGLAELVADSDGREGRTTALCIAKHAGRPVCVTAHWDLRLTIRSLPTLEVIVERPRATRAPIYDLRMVLASGEHVLLSAGNYTRARERDVEQSMLRMWSLDDLSLLWEDGLKRVGALHYIEQGKSSDHSIVITSQNGYGPWQIWDLDERRLMVEDEGNRASSYAWIYVWRGKPHVISVSNGVFTARRIEAIESGLQRRYEMSPVVVEVELEGNRFGSLTHIHGRTVLFGASVNRIRIWDLEDLLSEGRNDAMVDIESRSANAARFVSSLAVTSMGASLLWAGTGRNVVALNPDNGASLWSTPLDTGASVTSLAGCAELGIMVVGCGDGAIHSVELASGKAGAPLNAADELSRLATASWNGACLVFATVSKAHKWATRIWDLRTKTEIPTHNAYQLSYGEEDKRMEGLAVAKIGDELRFAFASSYGKLMISRYHGAITGPSFGAYRERSLHGMKSAYITALASGMDGETALLAAASAEGNLAIVDFASGETLASRAQAHLNRISGLLFALVDERTILVSGGTDGMLRFWTLELEEELAIDTGEPIRALVWHAPSSVAVGGDRGVMMVDVLEAAIVASRG